MKIRYYNILSIVLAFSLNCANSQNVVNFTTEEGFTNGALYNQLDWDANFQISTWIPQDAKAWKWAAKLQSVLN